ncbi:SPOR domain-containing protein [Halobacteriovorax sp. XZX-3]|uniref:SPOR domain-containing protein n=1 Tax=unclassified Halobacteriovorax TaxID=2639665 RepID=UPI003714ABD2
MNDKSNFYVFEKKEILLVVIFVILVAITSFFFGLKIGSNYAFEKAGLSNKEEKAIVEPLDEKQKIELTSPEEEKVKEIVQDKETKKVSKEELNKRIEESLKQKMVNEFSSENKDFNDVGVQDTQAQEVVEEKVVEPVQQPAVESETIQESAPKTDEYTGKYTIVVGSFESIDDAKEFAEGFRVLGFSPIVNEKEVPGKGNRFRVSLGAFERSIEAKQYVKKHPSLFAGRDYFFTKFD